MSQIRPFLAQVAKKLNKTPADMEPFGKMYFFLDLDRFDDNWLETLDSLRELSD